MRELEIDIDGEITNYMVPTSWDEITVEQFLALNTLKDQDNLTEIQMLFKTIKIITGISDDELDVMPITGFNKLVELIKFVIEAPDFGKEIADSIMIGDDEYFLKKEFNNLTVGEVIALEITMKKASGDLTNILPDMLCILLRKKKDNGKLENFKEDFFTRKEMFMKLPVKDFINIFSFFLNGEITSPKDLKTSSSKKKRVTKK